MKRAKSKTFPLYIDGKKTSWGKGCVANGFVFCGGTNGVDPELKTGGFVTPHRIAGVELRCVAGAEEQTKTALDQLKKGLEEMGSSIHNIVKMWFYVVGKDFPEGIGMHPAWLSIERAKEEWFKKNAPEFCVDKSPPTYDLVGVTGLGPKGAVVEIAAVATVNQGAKKVGTEVKRKGRKT